MSKDKPQQKPEAPKERPALLCIGIGKRGEKYVLEEVHLGADGRVVHRKEIRTHPGRKAAAGYCSMDIEHYVTKWMSEGLLP